MPPVVPYKALENFSKALYGTRGGTYSARVFRPVIPERFIEQFHITKYSGKLDCLVKEMLYIRMRKPTLNVQTDCVSAKMFV